MKKSTLVIILEAIVIIILLIILIKVQSSSENTSYFDKDGKPRLLSPRIYSNILPEKSFIIYNFDPLKEQIKEDISKNNLNLSLYVLNLRDGASFGINEDNPFEAVSMNKLPTSIMILKKVEDGKLSLNTLLPISPQDRDSSSGTLYSRQVSELSVKDLVSYMLNESDNTAFWVLAKQLTLEDGNQLTSYLNYYPFFANYTSSPTSLQITPKSTSNLFSSLYLSTILNSTDSEMVLSLLTNTSFDIYKYASLPKEVVVAQKYGSFFYNNTQLLSSCGIMYVQESRIFYCTTVSGLDKENASKVIGRTVSKIYNYIVEMRAKKYDF